MPVATGNWGCGAFGGDSRLKALIQIMAAAECGRETFYFTFGDEELCKDISEIYDTLINNNVTVSKLYQILVSFQGQNQGNNLYQYIKLTLGVENDIHSY